MSYVLAFLGFVALIILHEFGHFAVAKAVGMRVERFSLFMGPLLVKFRRGETEYGIGPFPLGGYVKITGMNPHEEMPDEVRPRAYYNQAVWKRIVVILAGPAMNLLIAFVIVYALVLSAGQTVTKNGQPVLNKDVAGIVAGAPAAKVLQPGDQIVSVDGMSGSPEAIRKQLATHRCAGRQVNGCLSATAAQVVIRRDGQLKTFAIRARYNATDKRPELGFSFGEVTAPVGAVHAASITVSNLWSVTTRTVSTVARIFEPQERKQLHSIVYGYTATQESFATSTTQALWVLALISLSLAIINLFPFLPLDGGHVFWAVAEKVRGKRIPFEIMERAGVVGFVLILMIFVIGLTNDISTLSGPGIGLR
ncbi:MAG TPA: site-2 protease family protein [Solirubrobacteraceae bacterium]|nr:site-2 protease family protein [Solirubrobacteraceae bacterium]